MKIEIEKIANGWVLRRISLGIKKTLVFEKKSHDSEANILKEVEAFLKDPHLKAKSESSSSVAATVAPVKDRHIDNDDEESEPCL
jgi:hypothetical protein